MTRTEWYKNAIVYQIYPFSFKDSNNDGWGDIPGIISKLDYLVELGITAIWFSPLYKSPCFDYGYDISDYRDIDPKFGTLDDFKYLLRLCHSKGIKVIMDMAINHSSIEHQWFKEAIKDTKSPYRDYYIIRKGKRFLKHLSPPTNWHSTFTGSAWKNIKGTDDFYLHLFFEQQADLNWENPKLRDEAVDIFNYWLDMGVDGFRLDVFNLFSKVHPFKNAKRKILGTGEEFYLDGPRIHEYIHELYVRSFNKYDCYTVGESYKPHKEDALKYVGKDSGELDTIFNFGHLDSDNIGKFFQKRLILRKFKDGLLGPQIRSYGKGWNTLVLENHDNSRSNSRFSINPKKFHYEASTFLPAITFLGFGTPFIYMGEEFGQTNVHFNKIRECNDTVSHFIYKMLRKWHFPKWVLMHCINSAARDMARVPIRWDESVNNGFNKGAKPWQNPCTPLVAYSLEQDLKKDKSIFRFYQKVINLKKTNEVAIYGDIKEYDHKHKRVIAYSRFLKDDGLFVFGNFSKKVVEYVIPDEIFPIYKKVLLNNYNNKEIHKNITLKPYEVFVLELQK